MVPISGIAVRKIGIAVRIIGIAVRITGIAVRILPMAVGTIFAGRNGTAVPHCAGMTDDEYRTEFALWVLRSTPKGPLSGAVLWGTPEYPERTY
jgi:hypothetical protein